MAKKSKETQAAETLVYCGPTLVGVAKQYTSFTNGLPAALEAYAQEQPAMKGLVVTLEELPETMRQLRERSGKKYRLYCLVQSKT